MPAPTPPHMTARPKKTIRTAKILARIWPSEQAVAVSTAVAATKCAALPPYKDATLYIVLGTAAVTAYSFFRGSDPSLGLAMGCGGVIGIAAVAFLHSLES